MDLAKDVRTETERFSHCLRLDDWHEPPLKNVSYDSKTRSTSGDNPVPDTDPKDKFNAGDSQNRTSRGVLELKQHIRKRALDDFFEMEQDLEHMPWSYSKVQILWAARKKKLKEKRYTIIDEYGNEKQIPIKDYYYRLFKSRKMALTWKKYEEDIYNNNHTTVWGSWWKDHQWGYKCCKQIVRNSYCTGTAGIEAAEVTTDLMKTDIARKQATKDQRMSAFEAAEAATDLMKADIARKQAIKDQRMSAFEAVRRAALLPDEVVDEDGKEVNPHIPKYVPNTPWYLSAEVKMYEENQDASCALTLPLLAELS